MSDQQHMLLQLLSTGVAQIGEVEQLTNLLGQK